jgi:hypothetical protein
MRRNSTLRFSAQPVVSSPIEESKHSVIVACAGSFSFAVRRIRKDNWLRLRIGVVCQRHRPAEVGRMV